MSKKTSVLVGITVGVICFILCLAIIGSIVVNRINKSKFNDNVYVVIYQYNVVDYNIDLNSEPTILYKERFTEDLVYESIITNATGGINKVVIKDGVIKVTESNCRDALCENYTIFCDNFLNNVDITCMPNGLIITLEVE